MDQIDASSWVGIGQSLGFIGLVVVLARVRPWRFFSSLVRRG